MRYEDYIQPLNKLLEIQDMAEHIHTLFECRYSVTIVEDDHFYVYDVFIRA